MASWSTFTFRSVYWLQAYEWYNAHCYKSFLFQTNTDYWIFLLTKAILKMYPNLLEMFITFFLTYAR